MIVNIKRTKEIKDRISDKYTNIILEFDITVELSLEEKSLTKKFYDPVVAIRGKEIRMFLSDYRVAKELSEKLQNSFIDRVNESFQLGGWENLNELNDNLKKLVEWSDTFPLTIFDDRCDVHLSNYRFSAKVHDGIRHLKEADAIIETIVEKLFKARDHLVSLDDWNGDEKIERSNLPPISM